MDANRLSTHLEVEPLEARDAPTILLINGGGSIPVEQLTPAATVSVTASWWSWGAQVG